MTPVLQPSLFDSLDLAGDAAPGHRTGRPVAPAAAGSNRPSLGPLGGTVERVELSHGAWVDVRPGWVSGSDEVFERLVGSVPWAAEERQMYERVVTVPRLLAWYGEHDRWPDPVLGQARDVLDAYYGSGEQDRFVSAGMCFYRDGRDGVAWHGDRIGRSRSQDVMVGIVSFGEPRALLLRPVGGGESLRFTLGHGDLLVMGGSCQRTWDHSVPKTSRPVGPRISVQLRPRGIR